MYHGCDVDGYFREIHDVLTVSDTMNLGQRGKLLLSFNLNHCLGAHLKAIKKETENGTTTFQMVKQRMLTS